jgi:UDP-N-acetylglucosamine acyltransferase
MKNVKIHPTAIISDTVLLGEGCIIGPYSILEGEISLGENCKVESHVVLKGRLEVGKQNHFYQFSSIGEAPQDISYKDEDTKVVIGDRNIFREYVSIHRGTLKQDGETIIGSDNLLMAHSHIGHDCNIGNHCIIVNSANIAGHVVVKDRVILSGACAVSQYITIGRGAYIGGSTTLDRDIPSFCTAIGNRVKIKGINIIGLRRQGFSREVIAESVEFLRALESSAFSPRSFVDNEEEMSAFKVNEVINQIIEDIVTSKVGIAAFSN